MDDEKETLYEARQARISPAAEVDEATLKRLMKTINDKHARAKLDAEQVYIFPGTLSSQAIDYYGTRMTPGTLKNYLKDVRSGIALMNSHRTGGLFSGSAELPVGRIFDGEVAGEPIKRGATGFDEQRGAELQVWHYLMRGIRVTEISNDDLIAGIDGGTIKDESIGFSIHPDGQYICSVCGQDYLNRGWQGEGDRCTHVAFLEYENADGGGSQRAFVWVEGAHALEGSLVYKGASPGAMVRKAGELARAGLLKPEQRGWLEDHYQVRLLGSAPYTMQKPKTDGKEVDMALNRTPVLEALKAVLKPEKAEEIRKLESDADFAQRAVESVSALAQSEAKRAEAAEGKLAALESEAAIGRQYRDDLVNAAVTARVRAQGAAFDAEKYRKVLAASGDLDFIKSEAATWEARAAEALQGGPGQHRQAKDDEPVRAPAGAYQ